MEREDAAGAGFGVAAVAKERFDTGRFVKEGQGAFGGEEIGELIAVMAGLIGNARERCALLFGFNHADRLFIDEQKVIGGSHFHGNFNERDTPRCGRIVVLVTLDNPAARDELRVDLFAGDLFRRQRHGLPWRSRPMKNSASAGRKH